VLRRIIRRAVRHAWSLGSADAVTPALVGATIDVVGDAYPALAGARDGIVEMAEREERRFRRTLESGYALLDREMEGLAAGDAVGGSVAFKLHDTYGFPVELTEEIASERGLVLDRDGFESEMAAQRERARAAWKGGHDDASPLYLQLFDDLGPTEFVGYERLEGTGRILAIVRDGEHLEEAVEGDTVEVYVDRTPFYAEAGGQVGDTGVIATETGRMRVSDTRFAVQGLNGHHVAVTTGTVRVGQDAALAVDGTRRERIRKSHTGTHLLHYALRDVLGTHVQQAGSLVEAGRLRFDFSHFASLSDEELLDVERETNERIIENSGVRTVEVTREEAEEMGALAFFGDKYGDRVRVVEAGDYSRELCGGTHVPTTGQVGPLVLLGESSIGANMRRVEAYTGATAYGYVSDLRRALRDTAAHLRVQPDRVVTAAAALVERSKAQEARIAAFEAQARSGVAGRLLEAAEDVDGAAAVVAQVEAGTSPDDLRALAIQVRDRIGTGIAVLGAARDGKAGLVAAASRDLVEAGISAGALLAGPAGVVGGGGSRDPELAQAGGPHGDRIEEALDEARRIVVAALRDR
jgi:alanyl-tRNA synthetase